MNSPLFVIIITFFVSSSMSSPVDKKVARFSFNELLNKPVLSNQNELVNNLLNNNPQLESLVNNPDAIKNEINNFLSNPQVQNNINNLLSNQQVQSNINNVLDGKPLEDGIQTGMDLLNSFKASTQPPAVSVQANMQPVPTTLPDLSVLTDALLANITEADREFFKKWLEVNLVFLVNNNEILSETEKGFILNSLPSIMGSKTVDEFYQNLNPLLLTGMAAYFKDPSIMFGPNPYADGAVRFLQQYFASPEAPEFLKNDPALQQYIIDYVNNVFSTNDLQAAILQISNDLVTYLNSASTQEIRNLIQAYFPELYQVVQNDSELDAILTTTYQYIVTQGVNLYTSILNIFQPAVRQAKEMARMAQKNKELLASLKSLGKK